MPRRPLRFAFRFFVNGSCLLSLLAFAGTAWLWWHGRKVYADEVRVRCGRRILVIDSSPGDMSVAALGGWPEARRASFKSWRTEDEYASEPRPETPVPNNWAGSQWERLGVFHWSASFPIYVTPDGSRFWHTSDGDGARVAAVTSQSGFSAHHAVFAVVLVPVPFLWLTLRFRRRSGLLRRARLVRCSRCGSGPPTSAAAPPFAPRVAAPRRLRRSGPRLCPVCGYDPRATRDGSPESGTVPAPEVARREDRVGGRSGRAK